MPLYRPHQHPWTNSDWYCSQNEDAENHCHPSWLSALRQEVQAFWEEAQEHFCTHQPLFPVRTNWGPWMVRCGHYTHSQLSACGCGIYSCFTSLFIWYFPQSQFVISICSDVQVGDVVTVGECRPLSKTVRFNVIKVAKTSKNKKSFSKF